MWSIRSRNVSKDIFLNPKSGAPDLLTLTLTWYLFGAKDLFIVIDLLDSDKPTKGVLVSQGLVPGQGSVRVWGSLSTYLFSFRTGLRTQN